MRELVVSENKLVLQDEVVEMFEKEVTPHGNGAKIPCPKKYIGKKAYIIIRK